MLRYPVNRMIDTATASGQLWSVIDGPPPLSHLCDIEIATGTHGFAMRATPSGQRRIGAIREGRVTGPVLSGRLFAGGGDWARVDQQGTIHMDMRCMIETDDGEGVYLTQAGRVATPAGPVRDAVMDRSRWGELDPADYYYRTIAQFEAAADGPYDWLNRIVAVGRGTHRPGSVHYRLWAVQ